MNSSNITRAEARARAEMVQVTSYQVKVDVTGSRFDGSALPRPDEHFCSATKVVFSSTSGRTWIDLIAETVFSATLDGEPLDLSGYDGYRLYFDASPGNHTLVIDALCRYSRTGEGLHRFVDPADSKVYLYSQFESADARRMYATFEQPSMKATFELIVTAPTGWTVISNSPTPEPEHFDAKSSRWHFAPTVPVPTYITALCAGEYHEVAGEIQAQKGTLPASVFCRQSMAAYLDAERILETTQRGFEVYENRFEIPYAFDKYDTVFVPEFNAGAMENAGCVTVRDEYLFRSAVTQATIEARDNTLLHELAHMWFGDLVTMEWWDDLWLNESFAEWSAYWCQDEIAKKYGGTNPWVSFTNHRKNWAYDQDQLPTTHPIAADMYDLEAVENNFDGITYAKGASVLKQLVSTVGQDAFIAGVREHLKAHAYGNATLADLLDALQRSSSRDLSWFTQQWLQTAGPNAVRADFDVHDGRFTRFDVVQTAPDGYPTLRNHRLAIGLYSRRPDAGQDRAEAPLVRTESIEVDIHGATTPIQALIDHQHPDLIVVNDRDLTYAKMRLDKSSLSQLKGSLHLVDDALTRALLWGSVWDMCRDGELSASDYIDIVLNNIGQETDSTAIQTQLAQARIAAWEFTAPQLRDKTNRVLVSGLARLLRDAEPESDVQLCAAVELSRNVNTAAGAALLKEWLVGREVPQGLEISQERRWTILAGLARIGAINEVEIAAENYRDNSITGNEQAAATRASLKDAAMKEWAWTQVTEKSLPNGTHAAICRSFHRYGHEELTRDYWDRYLAVVEDISAKRGIWSTRGYAVANAVVKFCFPLPDAAFITKLDEWLDQVELSDQVQARVLENRDWALRALAAQDVSQGR